METSNDIKTILSFLEKFKEENNRKLDQHSTMLNLQSKYIEQLSKRVDRIESFERDFKKDVHQQIRDFKLDLDRQLQQEREIDKENRRSWTKSMRPEKQSK
jgi:hypothetical protein